MLGVGNSITNNIFEKDLQHAACLLVDETADPLNAATSRQPTNSRLGDTLDVITENFTVRLVFEFVRGGMSAVGLVG
ncbi:hypothetical protein Hanom_Chr14g01267871 [Helianthus anomalus]